PGALLVPRPVVELAGGIPQEVPRGVEERVRDVRLAAPLGPALGALREVPLLVTRQRAHPARVWAEVLDQGELNREIPLRHGHRPAAVAIDDRDRRTPIALARDAPVV